MAPHRHRKDTNHNSLVAALQQSGWYVQDTSSTNLGYDCLIAKGGRFIPVEIKDGSKPPSAQKLTPHESAVHADLARFGVEVVLLTKMDDLYSLERPSRPGSYYDRGEAMSQPMTDTTKPALEIRVEHGRLHVSIGIETLAQVVRLSAWANKWDDATGDYFRDFAIIDTNLFAKDVASAMEDEAEDGSTPLTLFLDEVCEEAVNQGSQGLHEDFNHRIAFGQKSPVEEPAND
jgi:hypothetical protein